MANGSNLSEFAVILGLRLVDVIDGSPAATECLARMGGVEHDRIAQTTFRRVGKRSFVRAGQLGIGFRSNWQVPFVRSCTRRGIALVPGWSCADNVHRHDFASRVGLILPAILTGTLDGPPMPPSPFEHWIEQRLAGQTADRKSVV